MQESGNGSGKETGKRRIVLRKAYEVSYAVFRIASRTGSAALREHLERQALSLLDAAAVENYGWVDMVSRALEYLMQFGGDVGLIHETNKETIINELAELADYVAGPEKPATAEPVPLDDIFSAQEPLFRYERARSARHRSSVPEVGTVSGTTTIADTAGSNAADAAIAADSAERENQFAVSRVPAETNTATENNSAIRQTAIIEKIRQSGNCRLRDLLAVLPDYSERTLRYDLETLTERNLVERIGNGGPSVYYRLRQTA